MQGLNGLHDNPPVTFKSLLLVIEIFSTKVTPIKESRYTL